MKKNILLLATINLLVLNFTVLLYAQQPTYAKIYDYSYQVQAYSIVKTFDNGYIIAGEESNEALVYKIDSSSSIVWKKKIGSNNQESFKCLITTFDSCYVMAGNIFNTVDSTSDILCVKINSNGDTLWTKEIDMGYDDYALSVQQTFDNGYILAGYSSQNSMPLSMIAVVKLDVNGNLIWGKTFSAGNFDNFAYSVKQMPDSGYVVIGYVDSLSTSDQRTFLMKLNSLGDISWTKKQLIVSSNYTLGWDIMVTTNGLICYLGANTNNSIIMKSDFSGNVLWSKKYNVNTFNYDPTIPILKLHYISDNVYIYNSGLAFTKIDTAGIPLWTKEGPLQTINDVLENPDKGFMILGNPAMITKVYGYISLIKADSLGQCGNAYCDTWNSVPSYTAYPINMSTAFFTSASTAVNILSHPVIANALLAIQGDGCVIGGIEESKTDKNALQVFPDPAIDNITIAPPEKSTIEILNIAGQIIKTIYTTDKQTSIDVSDLSSGVYIIKAKTERGVVVKKFIKE